MLVLVRRIVRSRVLLALLLPVIAKLLGGAGRKLEQSRGPSGASRVLVQAGEYLRPQPRRKRSMLRRLLGR